MKKRKLQMIDEITAFFETPKTFQEFKKHFYGSVIDMSVWYHWFKLLAKEKEKENAVHNATT